MDLLHAGVDESLVTLVDNNPEGPLVDGTGDTGHRVGSLGAGGALVDPLRADLQLGLAVKAREVIKEKSLLVCQTRNS